MAAQPEMADAPLAAEPLRQAHHLAVEHLVQVGRAVDVVDHADVDVGSAEAHEQILETRLALGDVARAQILPLLPRRAEVALDDKPLAASGQRLPDGTAQLRVRRVEVQKVNAPGDGIVEVGAHGLGALPGKAFAAERYGTHPQVRAAQCTVYHHLCMCIDSPGRRLRPGGTDKNSKNSVRRVS